jgi:AhpD family alkylhydroperoxidase
MFASNVSTFHEFEILEANALKNGALDQKYKELICLATSIVSLCYGCIEYHTTQALEHGATRQEIAETAALAVVMGGDQHSGRHATCLRFWMNLSKKINRNQLKNNYSTEKTKKQGRHSLRLIVPVFRKIWGCLRFLLRQFQ